MKRCARHRNMSGIFFIHTKKNYFRSNVSEEENRMKNISLAYFLIIILSACGGGENPNTAELSGEIKGLGNDTIYIYGTDNMYDRVDTLIVENGKFSKTLSPDTLVAARLLFGNGSL